MHKLAIAEHHDEVLARARTANEKIDNDNKTRFALLAALCLVDVEFERIGAISAGTVGLVRGVIRAAVESPADAAEAATGPAVIIYGPHGCGKTRNAAALAGYLGKSNIVDGWTLGDPLPPDSVCLTSEDAFTLCALYRAPYARRAVPVFRFADVMIALGQTLSASQSAPADEAESLHQQQQARAWLAALPAWDGLARLQQSIDSLSPASSDAGPADTPLQPLPSPALPRSI